MAKETLPQRAERDEKVHEILHNPEIEHQQAAERLNTAESSVRRYRKKHNISVQAALFESPAEVEVLTEDNTPEMDVADINSALRKANNNLSARLSALKNDRSEYRQAVYAAVSDAISGLEIPKPQKTVVKAGKGDEEVAVALLSDIQLAKVTVRDDIDQYNSDIAEERVMEYAEKIVKITEIQRHDHPVNVLHLACLGDMIEGEEIFPGQMWLIDGGLYRQICVDGPRIMVRFLQHLLQHFERIDVTWVIGNHGRIGGRGSRNHDPETNGDRMLGRIVEMLMADEIAAGRITWNMPQGRGERNWYGIVEVGNYRAMAIHGDQIRGHSGFPWYGLGKKVSGWASGSIPDTFQDVFMGHWHQIASIPLNTRNVYVNGSTESYNTYAQENLAAQSVPAQWLLFVHPEKGQVTGEYKVWLGEEED